MFLCTLCLVCIGTSCCTAYQRTPGSGRYLDTKGEEAGENVHMSGVIICTLHLKDDKMVGACVTHAD